MCLKSVTSTISSKWTFLPQPKKKKVPLQQNEKRNSVFMFSSAENVMEIEAILRHSFVSVEWYFCFNRTMKKKPFFLIIDPTYSPKPQIILLEIAQRGWCSRDHNPAEKGLNFELGLLFPGNVRDSNSCSKTEIMICCLSSFADPTVTSIETPKGFTNGTGRPRFVLSVSAESSAQLTPSLTVPATRSTCCSQTCWIKSKQRLAHKDGQ